MDTRKKEKISIPKQSKFYGSHRYYRGQILKVLLQKRELSVKEVGVRIKKDYTVGEIEWLKKLLQELLTSTEKLEWFVKLDLYAKRNSKYRKFYWQYLVRNDKDSFQ